MGVLLGLALAGKMARRALHFVFKVADRNLTMKFYKDVLGMKVLRHEEFEEGCRAACNGPYDLNWSKTMVGYGPESNHFVIELTYNYGIGSYEKGNDFIAIVIRSDEILANARRLSWPVLKDGAKNVVVAPGGYKFIIKPKAKPRGIARSDPVEKVVLACTNVYKTIDYWRDVLGMELLRWTDKTAVFWYGENQCKLKFHRSREPIYRAKAYGRIAFACPASEVPIIESAVRKSNNKVLTPLTKLDTPGKATVTVVIVADPDGHEICFVDAESFAELSAVDPEADSLLQKAMEADTSDEWFKTFQGEKPAA